MRAKAVNYSVLLLHVFLAICFKPTICGFNVVIIVFYFYRICFFLRVIFKNKVAFNSLTWLNFGVLHVSCLWLIMISSVLN